jgi:hypothetical protein
MHKCKNESGFRADLPSADWMGLETKGLWLELEERMQVFDFSPVITIFHVFSPIFHPISQMQGFDFSPVAGFTGGSLCVSCMKTRLSTTDGHRFTRMATIPEGQETPFTEASKGNEGLSGRPARRASPTNCQESTQVVDFPRIRMRQGVKGLTGAAGSPNLPPRAVEPSSGRWRGFSTGCARGFRDRGRCAITELNQKERKYEAHFNRC